MGEIDDIFAGKTKSKGKAKDIEELEPKPPISSKKKKKKSKKVDVVESTAPVSETGPASGTKRKTPETVVDPSIASEPKTKRSKVEKKVKVVAARAENSDDERFKDSRGTGPRRKTEEGYAIYKEDELGIGREGGDTPLCPFDCDCCF